MAVNKLFRFYFILLVMDQVCGRTEDDKVQCQFGKPLRKQIDAEPIDGICLKDNIVIQLSKALRSITNEELGVTIFQEMLDKLEFVDTSKDLQTQLNNLVEKLDSKLLSYVEVLRRCDETIQPILLTNHALYSNNEKTDPRHRVSDVCSLIVNALGSSMKTPDWKNLHILPVSQPGTMCGATSLAHNIGSLLLSQCSQSKNVILFMEHGKFMSEGDIALAQITAKTVVDMLSEIDYVTVVGLNGNGYVQCEEGLLKANDINKFELARYIDSLTKIDSESHFQVNLTKVTENVTGELVIIHLTNTLDNFSNIKNVTESIITKKIIIHLRTILILSDQQPHINLKETVKNGTIITLPTQNVLGYEIARLFSNLKCLNNEKKEYYLSDPYYEPYSKAMTLSVGQITNTAFLSLDVKLKDFLEDLTYFTTNSGSKSAYTILFDRKEIVWMHKNFPRMEMMVEQPLRVYLRDIENLEENIVLTMINKTDGILNVTTKLREKKQYRWKHLSYKDLIVCIVSHKNESVLLPSAKVPPPLPPNILHHRLDLILQTTTNTKTLCAYQNKILTLSTGVVYLSPWCFLSPTEQLKLLETGSAVNVQSYMAYIKDSTGLFSNPGLHKTVRPDVATLAQILDHFKYRHNEGLLNKFIIRRYVTSVVSGVLEIYPGMILDSNLDPKRRSWFAKAVEHPGKIILTTPYFDVGGAGYIITLSHTIFEGRSAALHSNNDPILAVMSMDVTMGYITRLLFQMFPFCNKPTVKCFLMDDKGYLVSHPALFEPSGKIEQQHLTNKEPFVANDILNHELFVKKKSCASHLEGLIQRYYQFNTSFEEVLTNIVHGEHCVKYQIALVPGTNVFLGIVNVSCNLTRPFCPCSTLDRSCLYCKRMEQTECECPCECSLDTTSCSDTNTTSLELCSPPYEQGFMQTPWVQPNTLKSCPTFNCKAFETEKDCLGVVGCQWCFLDSDGESYLQSPFCSDVSLCFKGIFGSLVPYGDGTYNSQSTDEILNREWPSVGPVAGGILAFVLILGITLFCYRLRSVQSGLEHQCLHLHTTPDVLRMTHLEGDTEPIETDQTKNNLDSLLRDAVAPISPYRVSTNYRRPPGGDSDHGYSTMTPHDDSEQQTFAEPLLVVGGNNESSDLIRQSVYSPSPTTHLGSPHHVLAPVTVHRNMEPNYC